MSDSRGGRGHFRGSRGDGGGRGQGGRRGRGRGGSGVFSGVGSGSNYRGRGGGGPYVDRGGRGRGDFGGRGRGRGGRRGFSGGRDKFPGEPLVFRSPTGQVPQPDPEITELENKIIKDAAGPLGKMSQLRVAENQLPPRPAFGTKGNPVTLWANYFRLESNLDTCYLYTLDAVKEGANPKANPPPPKPTGRKLQSIIRSAFEIVKDTVPCVSELKSQIVSLTPLELPANNIVKVDYTDEGRTIEYDVHFENPILVDVGILASYLNTMQDPTGDKSYPKFSNTINAIGTILAHKPRISSSTSSLGKGRYFPLGLNEEKLALEGDAYNSVIRGYFQSVRPATGRLLLNVNVTHGVFRFHGPVREIMRKYDLANPQELYHLHRALEKLRAKVKILASKDRTPPSKKGKGKNKDNAAPLDYFRQKVICGLATTQDRSEGGTLEVDTNGALPHQVRFVISAPAPSGFAVGERCTVAAYYKKRYGYTVTHNLPVINVGTKARAVHMPAELVEILPGQALRRKTTADETRRMIEFACRSPAANASSITTVGRSCLRLDDNPVLVCSHHDYKEFRSDCDQAEFNVSLDKSLLTIQGRELIPPQIVYATGKTTPVSEGSWNMRDVEFAIPGKPITRWTWVHINPWDHGNVQIAVQRWVRFMAKSGIPIRIDEKQWPQPTFIDVRNKPVDKTILQDFLELRQNPFVFVVLPDKGSEIYNAVKTAADVHCGFQTVCIVRKNLVKMQDQTFANEALKVNLKAGGVNHKLKQDVIIVKEGKTMVVGYDVTHPTNISGDTRGLPSLVGMVASIDKHLGQFPASAWAHEGKVEILGELLVDKFKERLKLWSKHNGGQLPENIIIFRDGVSEGQFQLVLEKELPLMRKACEQLYPAKRRPKFLLEVSVKRHQTRFYPTDEKNMTKSRNVKNGTVVDRGVTLARNWDYFLVAHNALQGTARPAHYTVLLDEVVRPMFKKGEDAANALEQLTNELSYLFGRATKAVSICPPAYYADIVCTRHRIYKSHWFESSDTGSVASAQRPERKNVKRGKPEDEEWKDYPQVHPNLLGTMYYI